MLDDGFRALINRNSMLLSKKDWSFFICMIFIAAACGDHKKYDSNEANRLLELEREAIRREFKNDTAYLSSIMDSTFIELSEGKIKRKHDVLRTIFQQNVDNANKKISMDSFILEEPVVHLYDDAAVVTFVIHTYKKKIDSLFERRTRFYDLWVQRNGKWKAATWQATPLEF